MTTLTMKEEKRLEIVQRLFRGELTVMEAEVVIGVSERQCYRIKAKVTERGAKGVAHGNRGRPCKRKTLEKEVRRVVELAKGKYRGFKRSTSDGETGRAGEARNQS
jgi:DNA-directed RNA polymerase sigma subunit (sigma70/sigma32)